MVDFIEKNISSQFLKATQLREVPISEESR